MEVQIDGHPLTKTSNLNIGIEVCLTFYIIRLIQGNDSPPEKYVKIGLVECEYCTR